MIRLAKLLDSRHSRRHHGKIFVISEDPLEGFQRWFPVNEPRSSYHSKYMGTDWTMERKMQFYMLCAGDRIHFRDNQYWAHTFEHFVSLSTGQAISAYDDKEWGAPALGCMIPIVPSE